MPAGRPAKYNTPEELEQVIQDYFDLQEQENKPVTITGLAYHLGFESRQSIYDYKENPEYSYILKRATFYVESQYEARLSGNVPTGAIFALKNMNWKDKQETELSGKDGGPIQITGMEIVSYKKPNDEKITPDPGTSNPAGLV
jgi:hypothetical protein